MIRCHLLECICKGDDLSSQMSVLPVLLSNDVLYNAILLLLLSIECSVKFFATPFPYFLLCRLTHKHLVNAVYSANWRGTDIPRDPLWSAFEHMACIGLFILYGALNTVQTISIDSPM